MQPIENEKGPAMNTAARTSSKAAASSETHPVEIADCAANRHPADSSCTTPSPARERRVDFYIVRHGKTQFNEEQRVQGWCDSPLTAEGVRSAREMGCVLAPVDFAAAYASDRGRTRQTLAELMITRRAMREGNETGLAATPAAASATPSCPLCEEAVRTVEELETAGDRGKPVLIDGVPARCDARLREWCYGDLEGTQGMQLHARLTRGYGRELTFEEENERLPETADILARYDESGRAERFEQIEARLRSFFDEAGGNLHAAGGGNVLVVTHSFFIRTIVYLFDRARINNPLRILNGSLTRLSFDGASFTLHEIGVTSLPR